ncbi:hypothetical protein ACFLY2_00850 [Patescibacteria group bacterium]
MYILKRLNQDKEMSEYFDLVLNANKDNKSMEAWKQYRINNIPKVPELTHINE